jgi:hypothetical protein
VGEHAREVVDPRGERLALQIAALELGEAPKHGDSPANV